MSMLAQVSEDTAKSFIERVPDIIRAAATNPLGLVALIVLCFAILVFFLFKKSNAKIKLTALAMVVVSVIVLALVAMHESGPTPGPGPSPTPSPATDSCKVNGFVFNDDFNPAPGLQKVKLSYVTAVPTNSTPVQVATTGPDGSFSFNCSQIKPDAFPIHLQATMTTPNGVRSIESEDQLVFGENPKVVLYLSPRAISNHYRLSKEIYRVPSAQLFKSGTTTVTDPATTTKIPTNKIAVIPRAVVLPKDTITRIRMTPPPR
jgi:hypothetical protein